MIDALLTASSGQVMAALISPVAQTKPMPNRGPDGRFISGSGSPEPTPENGASASHTPRTHAWPENSGGRLGAGDWYPVFLETLKETGNIAASCRAAGISRRVCYDHRDSNQEFADAWADALNTALDAVEASLRNEAIGGDVRAAHILLRAHRHEYRDNPPDINIGVGIQIDGQDPIALLRTMLETVRSNRVAIAEAASNEDPEEIVETTVVEVENETPVS